MNKKIVLVPAGGKSSRFIGDSPKMMRTHPQGKLLIEKALETFNEIDNTFSLRSLNSIRVVYSNGSAVNYIINVKSEFVNFKQISLFKS